MPPKSEVPETVEIYRAEHTTWNIDRLMACFTDDAVVIRAGRPPYVGKNRINELVREWARPGRKNMLMKHLRTVIDANQVALEWETTGIEANGTNIHKTGANVYQLENGKIKYLHIYRDL